MCLAATDWNEVTAISTVALAAITGVLAVAAIVAAWYARRGLQAAAADLRATNEATQVTREMAEAQIQAARRPLLIDVPCEVLDGAARPKRIRYSFGDGHAPEIEPNEIYVHRDGANVYIVVPLRNVGTGLASIPHMMSILAAGSDESIESTSYGRAERSRVPPGETTRISCVAGLYAEPKHPWVVTISVMYYDYLNGQEAVTVVYLEQEEPGGEWALADIEHALPERAPDRPSLVFTKAVNWPAVETRETRRRRSDFG